MVRVALAGYLSLVTLAGPWCCCCIGLRLVAGLLPPPAPPADQPSEVAHTCCQHSAPVPASRPTLPEQPTDHPRDPDCPCRQHMERVAAVPPATGETQTSLQPDQAFLGFLSAPALVTGEFPLLAPDLGCHSGECSILPFLSALDLRCALHIMRC
jgi:hypothetical protein